MKSTLFEHECTKVSKTIGRKHDIRVTFRGADAYTDGHTVNLPALDQFGELSGEQVKVGRGYVDHETAHLIYTDMELYKRSVQEAQGRGDRLYASIANGLEDIRIERLLRRDYPGTLTNLTATSEAVNREYLSLYERDPSVAEDARRVSGVALTWEGRRRDGYPTVTNAQCMDTLSAELRGQVERWIDALDACNSTADVMALAGTVSTEIREEARREAEKQKAEAEARAKAQEKDRQESKGEKGKGEPEARPRKGEGEGADGEGEEGDDGEGDRGKGDADGEGEAGGSAQGDGEGEARAEGRSEGGDEYDSRVRDGVEADPESRSGGGIGSSNLGGADMTRREVDLEAEPEPLPVWVDIQRTFATDRAASTQEYRAYDTSFDKVHTRETDRALNHASGERVYADMKRQIGGVLGVMQRKIQRAVIAREQRGWHGGQEWGRLDNRRLVAAVQGHSDVFRLKEDRQEVNTAVQVLIDLSGSMSGAGKSRLAQQAAIALAETLSRTSVALEITGFHCESMAYDYHDARSRFEYQMAQEGQAVDPETGTWVTDDSRERPYSRWSALDNVVFKDFNDSLREARRSLGAIAAKVGGDNCDGEAVMWAYQRLAKRPERKKIMLVLSDGQPATSCSWGTEHLERHLRDVVGHIEAQRDTSIVGIGIMSYEVRKFYQRNVVVTDVSQLGGALMDQLARMMLGEGFVANNAELMQARKLRK